MIEPFIELGFTDVSAYQAAGNIAFRSDDAAAARSERIEAALAEAYGFAAPVFLRNRSELRALVDAEPFSAADIAGTEGRIQVTFMHNAPDANSIAAVLALVPEADRVAFLGREWFWLPARGISDSELPVTTIEQIVGPMTTRTLGTLSRLLARFG